MNSHDMKFNQGIGDEIGRFVLFLFLFVFIGAVAIFSAFICFAFGRGAEKLSGVFALAWLILWWYLMAVAFRSMAAVTLTDEGVHIRTLIKKRFWSWSSIVQAGVLWRRRKYGYYNDFVLLPQGGSLRKYKDKTFVLRNNFKLIHLPDTEQVRAFVRKHYGPLDFDLSDGRDEGSIVVD